MHRRPITLYADEPLVHAVGKFSELRFGRFPVVDRQGALVGIITQGDIIRAMLRRLEVDYTAEEIHRYRASHIFEDIVADEIALVFGYQVEARNFARAGEASSGLKRTLSRLGIAPQIIRRVAVATYEAEINIVVYTDGGDIVAEVRPDRVKIEAVDKGPGIPNIEQAMLPGFSTAGLGEGTWFWGRDGVAKHQRLRRQDEPQVHGGRRHSPDDRYLPQQILGNCSPVSMSTIRQPPMRLRMATLPGCSSTTSPMMAASCPRGSARIAPNTASAASAAAMAMHFPSLAT
jgi:anti-sigma regulatory factor (Ser/Thr protein kinase)